MRGVRTILGVILLIGFFWVFPLSLVGYCNDAVETSIYKRVSLFVRALGESDTATFFAMVPSSFLIQEVMPNGEVVSYWSSKEWGNELKKTSINFRGLQSHIFNVKKEGFYADAYGKLVEFGEEKGLRGYFWSRLRNTENGWKIIVFKAEWSSSSALEKIYVIPGPNYKDEMINIQKWSGLSFGEDQNNVLKKLGYPDKTVDEISYYKHKLITIEYVTQWDLWIKGLSIQNQSYKTVRGVGVGDSEVFLKEKYGQGYDITLWGKSKRKTYSYKGFTDSEWMEFEIIDGRITEISFIDWTQERKKQR